MSPKEIRTTPRPSNIERSWCDKEYDDQNVTDNGCAPDGIELWCNGRVERIACIKNSGDMGVILGLACANRFINGIFIQRYCVRIVDM